MRFLFILISIAVVFSCKSTKKSVDAASLQESTLVISMKKTACYGTCPVYEIQIYGDLSVKLKGEQHIDLIGDFESSISQERLDQLKEKFREADFFSFEEKYWEAYTDLPTTYVYFNDDGKELQVMDYVGAPDSLKDLEKEVGMLLEELDWTPVN